MCIKVNNKVLNKQQKQGKLEKGFWAILYAKYQRTRVTVYSAALHVLGTKKMINN
jgi:hypothetical protein